MEYGTWMVSVQQELEKNKRLTRNDINSLKEWMQKQPHLPEISDNQIVLFLHAVGYSLQSAKTLVENYYTLRTSYKHFFDQRDFSDPKLQQVMDATPSVLYGRDRENRYVYWTKILDPDPSLYYPTIGTKIMFMLYDVHQVENGTAPGYTLVLDGKGFTLQHIMRCSFTNGRNIITYVQTASTVIIDKVFLINVTPAAEKLMNLLRPFINSDLFDKITVCPDGNLEELLKVVPREALLKDYGGEGPSIVELKDEWKDKLLRYGTWFEKEQLARVDEDKRRGGGGGNKSQNETMNGSFKSLSLD